MTKIKYFFQHETVFCISFIAAVISCIFVHPSFSYFTYIDFRTLALLFCLMVVVSGFRTAGLFTFLANRLCAKATTLRTISIILVFLCFFSSMFVTNDVALLTFAPLAITIMALAQANKYLIWVVVLQTVAANLGSMLTPIGNPQNLYLFSYYNLSILKFFSIVFPIWILSFALIFSLCFFIPAQKFSIPIQKEITLSRKDLSVYTILLIVCFLVVFRFITWPFMLIIVTIILLIFNPKILVQADYMLLLTFVCFFIFAGNLENIGSISTFIHTITLGHEYLSSVLLSQVISNVPTALVLSEFTEKANLLILGVNIGGLGTPIASLASLISLKLYSSSPDSKTGKFLVIFTIINVALLLLLSFCAILIS